MFFVLTLAIVLPLALSAQKVKNQKPRVKSLVVFFSHAGENYAVGNIAVGNTKIVADYISEATGADQFEIVAEKSYDMPYAELIKVAKDEATRGELPAYRGSVDVTAYDTIFIGGPIWWGTFPRVMFTFFKQNNLGRKTLIPFATHEGSGLGSIESDLRKAYPKARLLKGFAIYGHEVRTEREKVVRWLRSLGR